MPRLQDGLHVHSDARDEADPKLGPNSSVQLALDRSSAFNYSMRLTAGDQHPSGALGNTIVESLERDSVCEALGLRTKKVDSGDVSVELVTESLERDSVREELGLRCGEAGRVEVGCVCAC